MIDDVKFLKAYIQAIDKRFTILQLSKKLKLTYASIMNRKKSISDKTGKKLPPLTRPTKKTDAKKLNQLVAQSYSIYKSKQNAK